MSRTRSHDSTASAHRAIARIIRQLVVLSLAVAALVMAGPTATASASEQERITTTSSLTGVKYSVIHSCAATHPKFSALGGDRVVELQIVGVRPGAEEQPLTRFVGGDTWGRTRFFQFRTPNSTATPDTTFILRERFEGEGAFREVFRITPDDCPDYAADPLSVFVPIDPTRTLDTRPGIGPDFAGVRPAAGTVIDIPASSLPAAPSGVVAVSLTVSLAGSDTRGFVQAFPTGRVQPGGTANVNSFGPGQTVGNLAVVPVGDGGGISLFTSVGGHLIVDVNGYFVDSAATARAGRIATITPKRMFDTRPDFKVNSTGVALTAGQTMTIDMTSLDSGLPAGASAAIVNVTATRSAAAGFVQAAAGGTLVPGATAITNVTGPGQTSGGLAIVPLSPDGTLDFHSSGGADVVVDLTGWFTGDDAADDDTGLFVPLDPERVYDTRPATTVNYEDPFDQTRRVPSSRNQVGLSAVAPQASAVFVNATAINPDGTGFVQFAGNGDLKTSNLNYPSRSVVANAAVVTFNSPSIKFFSIAYARSTGGIDLTIDLAGYFTA